MNNGKTSIKAGTALRAWHLIHLILGCSLGLFLLLILSYGYDEAGLRQQIRWSARISFTLFCVAFGISALHFLIKHRLTAWLLQERKFIGISFAVMHLVHLGLLIILQAVYHPVFDLAARTSLLGGGIAYLFVVLMLLTSFEKWRNYLSQTAWKVLHTIGGYWIWSIFMTTYFKRADTEPVHWLLVGILLLILILRGIKLLQESKKRLSRSLMMLLISMITVFPLISQDQRVDADIVLIKNGTVYDGSGNNAFPADVLIDSGNIKDIVARPNNLSAPKVIDASGMIVSPGFIDIHAHGDPLATPEFKNFLSMGVTSIALGMDGSSISAEKLPTWLKEVDDIKPGVNILPFIGHGTLRRESGIESSSHLSEDQIENLTNLIQRAFQLGCWGLSMGLEYMPGYYAEKDELEAIAKAVGKHEGLITSHIRNEDDQDIEESLEEMLDLSIYCPINISHLKVVYGKGSKRAVELLDILHEKRPEAHRVTADFYPYTASYTGIGIVFPEWAKIPKKYAAIREERGEELLEYLRNKIQQRNGPEATLFGTAPYKGKTLQDLVNEYNRPYEIILRDVIGPYGASAAYFVMDDELQKALMLDDIVAIGSDGSPTMHHPRGYGSFAKVIEEDVVQDSLLTLENAIYKMSGLPAEIAGLKDRGIIKKGFVADLLIFDPRVVKSTATFDSPHQLALGFKYVFVNGKLVKEDNEFYNRSGAVLLKHKY